jgi:hypothetical protein
MHLSHLSSERVRSLALGLFLFGVVAAAIVWFFVRPYGSHYFFMVYLPLAFGLPFAFYAVGVSRAWMRVGLVATAVILLLMDVWGYRAAGLAPRAQDWASVMSALAGLALAWGTERMQMRARDPHAPQRRRE